ncbi:MAG: TlpA family protein disulfide reductase [Acidobacteria bacterium]|jgi:peroxiredoxin|nr:TlpA family protein disulfide reductase [Acidobacteriota bacterium]
MRFLSVLFLTILLTISVFAQSNGKVKPLAENFAATSLDGTTFDLAALKGKVVVVSFWTTRCAICAAEVPKLNKLADNYKNKDVVFLGLTTDNEAQVKDFLRRKPFNFILLPDSFGILLKYAGKDRNGNVNMGFPTHYLINQKGEIELKTDGFDKASLLYSSINRLLLSD